MPFDELWLMLFSFSYSLSCITRFLSHFNIPEIEMGLEIDDKETPCHSLIGGIFFFLTDIRESLFLIAGGI